MGGGIALTPLDVTATADAYWLQALVIPDQQRRHKRLAAAIDVTREKPPELVAGNVLAVLFDLHADIPADALLCVFSTQTLYQMSEQDIAEQRGILTDYSQQRPMHCQSFTTGRLQIRCGEAVRSIGRRRANG